MTTPPRHRARAPAHEALPAPGWARVHRVQLIRREVREYLSPAALEVLLEGAEHVVEGAADAAGPSGSRYYATVMVTIDLRRRAAWFREPADEATAERVAELLQDSPGVRQKLAEVARVELARLADVDPASLDILLDHQVRVDGTTILIDLDVAGSPRAVGGR